MMTYAYSMKTAIYIDAANLHRSARSLNIEVDYRKLHVWLVQKYQTEHVFLFIGYVQKYNTLYKKLGSYGYQLVFKETILMGSTVKGNCDAEMVVCAMKDFYESGIHRFVLITGDGDFRCLVDFLTQKEKPVLVVAPNSKKCSILLKKSGAKILMLDEHYHKFSQ